MRNFVILISILGKVLIKEGFNMKNKSHYFAVISLAILSISNGQSASAGQPVSASSSLPWLTSIVGNPTSGFTVPNQRANPTARNSVVTGPPTTSTAGLTSVATSYLSGLGIQTPGFTAPNQRTNPVAGTSTGLTFPASIQNQINQITSAATGSLSGLGIQTPRFTVPNQRVNPVARNSVLTGLPIASTAGITSVVTRSSSGSAIPTASTGGLTSSVASQVSEPVENLPISTANSPVEITEVAEVTGVTEENIDQPVDEIASETSRTPIANISSSMPQLSAGLSSGYYSPTSSLGSGSAFTSAWKTQ